jgi:hypothetical protein
MDGFRGTVYVFENPDAERVKVGVTHGLGDRLAALKDLWSGRTVTCQICGRRLNSIGRRIRPHKATGRQCPGGYAPPLEQEVTLAEESLEDLRGQLGGLSGTRRGSITRRISALEKRIERFRDYKWPAGRWLPHTEFVTERAEEVEKLSHEILGDRLDETAALGEIFFCSPEEAIEAVEAALDRLGLLGSVRKDIRL